MAKNETKKGSPQIDWEKMDPEFMWGPKSIRQLAKDYDCNDKTIRNHYNNLDIRRDPSNKIKSKALEKVRSKRVRSKAPNGGKISDKQIIDESAEEQSVAIIEIQDEVTAFLVLARRVRMKLEEMVDQIDEISIKTIIVALRQKQFKFAAEQVSKLMTLPVIIKMLKDLAGTISDIIDKTAKVYNIDFGAGPGDDNPLETFIKSISGTSLPIKTGAKKDD